LTLVTVFLTLGLDGFFTTGFFLIGFFTTGFFGSGRKKKGRDFFVGFALTTGFLGD
jgi:hypothetical protein